jgi:hypothetical protein
MLLGVVLGTEKEKTIVHMFMERSFHCSLVGKFWVRIRRELRQSFWAISPWLIEIEDSSKGVRPSHAVG